MGGKSKIKRLGRGFAELAESMLADGATQQEVADGINAALERAGRPERVSRSGVQRASPDLMRTLELKRRVDEVAGALADAGPSDGRAQAQAEILRTLVMAAALDFQQGESDPRAGEELERLVRSFAQVARTEGQIEEAARLARREAADAMERELAEQERRRPAGGRLSKSAVKAIRKAVEG